SCNGRLRWIEVASMPGTRREFRCLASNRLLETFDRSHLLSALTVQPTHFRTDAAASLPLGRSHQTHHQRSLLVRRHGEIQNSRPKIRDSPASEQTDQGPYVC